MNRNYIGKMVRSVHCYLLYECVVWIEWGSPPLWCRSSVQKVMELPYSGKLSREKTFANWWKIRFCGENFHGLLAFPVPRDATPPNFAEKTFANSLKTAKFAKVFSLESFPLYGIMNVHTQLFWVSNRASVLSLSFLLTIFQFLPPNDKLSHLCSDTNPLNCTMEGEAMWEVRACGRWGHGGGEAMGEVRPCGR